MNENIIKALAELEEDLKKLQSAREQVLSVVSSNQEFAKTANDLVVNTHSLLRDIKTVTEGAFGNLSASLEESKFTIDNIVKVSINQIEHSVIEANEANMRLNEALETKQNEVVKFAKDSIEKNTAQSIKTVNDFTSSANTTIEQQRSENLRTLNQILETHNYIKELIGQLLNFDLPYTLKSINSNIEQFQSENNKQFRIVLKNQRWFFGGFVVILLVIIILYFVA